ncbi:MAG: HTTM domain-containing protein [Alphaproteobacteria bacterium]|nr:HTTM domain-containing protein [Alphaproteobacteria bacterium]
MTKNGVDSRSIFTADLQALSAFRILFGLVILTDFIFGFLPTRSDFYTETGFLPHWLQENFNGLPGHYSLLHVFPETWFLDIFTWVYGILIIFFIIGYRTRYVKILLFICQTSLYCRAITTMMGADSLMRLFLLWSSFVPLDRYWSVDAALRRGPREVDVPPVCIAGIKTQIAMLYLFSGMFKVFGPDWWNGHAVGFAMRDTNNGTLLGQWLATTLPWISPLVSLPVMFFQLSFSVLVYSPFYNNITRGIALMGAVVMHLSFIFLLAVGLFPQVCLSYLPILVPDAWWNALFAKRRKRLEQITIYYDPPCSFCEKIARLLREACLSPFTPIVPADQRGDIYAILRQHNSWVVVDGITRTTYLKWEAVAFVLRQTPLTYLAGAMTDISYVKGFFANVYDAIGRNRKVLGKLAAIALPYRDQPDTPTPLLVQILCGTLMVILMAVNISSVPIIAKNYYLPWVETTARIMQIYQKWDLFGPQVSQWQYEYKLIGKTRNQQEIDLWSVLDTSKISRTENGRMTYFNERWHKYMIRMLERNKHPLADYFLKHICELYNADAIKNGRDPIEQASVQIELLPLEGETLRLNKRYGNFRYRHFSCVTQIGDSDHNPQHEGRRHRKN